MIFDCCDGPEFQQTIGKELGKSICGIKHCLG